MRANGKKAAARAPRPAKSAFCTFALNCPNTRIPSEPPGWKPFKAYFWLPNKDECLDQLIHFGERSLRHALDEYLALHQHERNHQGLDDVIPFPDEQTGPTMGRIIKAERLGGLPNFYYRRAA